MPRHSTYRSRGAVEPVGRELSSGQLGIGIAVAVIFGLVCFILGYVVANVDRPLQTAEATTNAGTTPAPASRPASGPASAPTPAAESPGGTEAPAPADTASAEDSARRSTPTGPSDPANRVSPTARTVAPLPAPGGPTPMTRSKVSINTNPPTDKPATTEPATTEPAPASAPPPIIPPGGDAADLESVSLESVASSKPVPPAAEQPPAPEKPAAKAPAPEAKPPAPVAKPPANAPTVSRGKFVVQVAAFNGPRRSEQAKESRKKLKEATGLDAEIITSSDGAYEKVVVSGFSTRGEAEVQCKKLKAKSGYESSWVVRLP